MAKMRYDQYYELGVQSYTNKNYQMALNHFKKANEVQETNDTLNYIGCCYFELRDYKAAWDIFWRLSDNNPNWARPSFNLGRVLLRSGHLDEALIAFKEAARREPYDEDVYFYLGVYYYHTKDYSTAKEYYEKSLEMNNEQPETHLNLGLCYLHLENYKEALKETELAFKYDNHCIDAIYNKGLILEAMKNYQDAIDYFLQMEKYEPSNTSVMFDIGYCYYKAKDYENAYKWVNKIISVEPTHGDAMKLFEKIKNKCTTLGNGLDEPHGFK